MANIIIIDDDDVIQELIQKFLKQEGHNVLIASDGLAGLDIIHNNTLDLIIVDIFMPEMDGFEVINKVQLEFPGIPIIAISGGGSMVKSNSFLKAAMNFGALGTLTKPINKKKLISMISLLLDRADR
jgi:DNA-binding response OmpR family regulator